MVSSVTPSQAKSSSSPRRRARCSVEDTTAHSPGRQVASFIIGEFDLVDRTGAAQVDCGGNAVHPALTSRTQVRDIQFGPDCLAVVPGVRIRTE